MTKQEKARNLGEDYENIYNFLADTGNEGANATQVGIVVGREPAKSASSWGSYRLKKLIAEDLVEKDEETKKYTVIGATGEDEADDEPIGAEEEEAEAQDEETENEAEAKGESDDADDSEDDLDEVGNTSDELVPNQTVVEFKPHALSKEAKDGKKKVRGTVTKVFFEDDGRRFTQVKMHHNDKKCFKRDNNLTVIGQAPAKNDEEE